jgi:tetratricopeptide (TPR) repeat protein
MYDFSVMGARQVVAQGQICYFPTVSIIFLAMLSLLLAADQPGASKPANPNAASASVHDPKVEKEYMNLLEADDAAQTEVDRWIREANAFEAQGAGFSRQTLSARIEQRFAPVKTAYQDFLRRHPEHVRARLAFGSFLYDIHEEEDAVVQWEKALELDPKNPAAWNNLAHHYGHRGPVKKAFEHYEKAVALNPEEPVYLQNFATTMYLFRKDAMELYEIDEPEVFNRSLALYRKAIKLDPENFPLAADYAQSYYGIRPLRTNDALAAWSYALKVANDDLEREGVFIHLARINLLASQFDTARQYLARVKDPFYNTLKDRLARNIVEREKKAAELPEPEPSSAQSLSNDLDPRPRGELPLQQRQ